MTGLLPTRIRRTVVATLALTGVLGATGAATATAATPASLGATTIALDGSLAAALRAADVTITAGRPARGGARQLVLPVSGGTVDSGASLVQRGRVTLRHGRSAVTLTSWQTRVRRGQATLTAVAGGRRRTLFSAAAPARRLTLKAATGGVTLRVVELRLTRAGARWLRAKLALRELPAGVLGTLKIAATVGGRSTGGSGGDGGRGGSGGGGGDNPPPPPGCTPGFSVGQIDPAPAPLARPAGAADVSGATVVWRPRESFLRYVATGEGATASNGAVAGAPERGRDPGGVVLPYTFTFTLKPGSWYDTATGTAGLLTDGTVRFQYSDHGIDMTLEDPEIEINGAGSRAIFTLVGGDCTPIPPTRGVMLDLMVRAPTVNGATRDYGEIRATITRTGQEMFSDFYPAGDPWGSIAVSLTS